MTSRDFCYWLQGFLELRDAGYSGTNISLTHEQLDCIKRNLAMVFKHEIDPSMGDEAHRDELQDIHDDDATAKQPIRPKRVNVSVLDQRGPTFDPNVRLMC